MITNETFYFSKAEPYKSCLLAMRDFILRAHETMTETRKYGMPCFSLRGKIFCYLWTDKKSEEPYFLMVDGKQLHHPKLETGKRARMKILRVDPNKDLPVETIKEVLNEALKLRNTEN